MKQVIDNPMALVTTSDRTSKAGKVTGTIARFSGATAGELRKRLKAEGLSGIELSRKVNAILCGETDVRKVVGMAYVQHLANQGYVPDLCKKNKADTKATLELIRVQAPDVSAAEVAVMEPKKRANLMALLKQQELADKQDAATLTV